MELFVYDWFYTGYTVYGHCLDGNGKYALLKVRDFRPSCYVDGERIVRSDVIPIQRIEKMMVTSRNIARSVSFEQVFFSNAAEMRAFVSDVRNGALHVGRSPRFRFSCRRSRRTTSGGYACRR